MHHQIGRMSLAFGVLAVGCLVGAYYASDFLADILLSLFGTLIGAAIGLMIVNLFLDKKSRKIAAGPLMTLVGEPVTRYHNELVVELGRNKFGIPQYSKIVNAYNTNNANPQVLSQEERRSFHEIIDDHLDELHTAISDIDNSLSILISVLGWSYDAEIIAAALTCKKNIAGFRAITSPQTEEEKLKRIEYYIDIDTTSSAVIMSLAKIYGTDIRDYDA